MLGRRERCPTSACAHPLACDSHPWFCRAPLGLTTRSAASGTRGSMRPRLRSVSARRCACSNPTHWMPTPHPSCSQSEASVDAQRAQVSASLGIVVRKALNQQDMIARDFNAELRAKVGTKTLINPDDPGAAGFYCKETGKTLRDSISYLDHINGKRRA